MEINNNRCCPTQVQRPGLSRVETPAEDAEDDVRSSKILLSKAAKLSGAYLLITGQN